MKKILFSLLAIILLTTSCGGIDPVKFNDDLMDCNNKITGIYESFNEGFSSYLDNENYPEIAPLADSALVNINVELDKLNVIEAPEDGKEFKESVITSCNNIKNMIEVCKKYAVLTEESTDEEFNKIDEESNQAYEVYSKSYDKVGAIQKEYAKNNNYEIEK